MCFYLKPPRGGIQLYKLEECINQRTNLLRNLIEDHELSTNFNCLIDDTALDRTGHFMLRILSVKEGSIEEFICGETKLFNLRLNSYDAIVLKRTLNIWIQHIKDCLKVGTDLVPKKFNFLSILQKLCIQLLRRDIFEHIFCKTHPDDCEAIFFELPFVMCMKIVSSYEVEIKNGVAFVPCTKWKLLLKELYNSYLKLECDLLLENSNLLEIFDDPRLEYLIDKRRKVSVNQSTQMNNVEEIDQEARKFPLCMQILHSTLRKEHRLHHDDRVNLTLFLKNIGLPLNQAVIYWKSEYEKPSDHCTSCSHQWKESEKRYVYSIRHMYGLEGSRRNYGCRNCKQLQEDTVSVRSTGGCPFKIQSNAQLRKMLETRNIPDDVINRILKFRNDDATMACKLFVKYEKAVLNKNVNFATPVQYYLLNK